MNHTLKTPIKLLKHSNHVRPGTPSSLSKLHPEPEPNTRESIIALLSKSHAPPTQQYMPTPTASPSKHRVPSSAPVFDVVRMGATDITDYTALGHSVEILSNVSMRELARIVAGRSGLGKWGREKEVFDNGVESARLGNGQDHGMVEEINHIAKPQKM